MWRSQDTPRFLLLKLEQVMGRGHSVETETNGMQAGCYGRAFCPVGSYPRKRILQVCQSLRILNALRAPNVGVPLTLPQLEALTHAVLVSRLVNARRHLLALRIAEMLNMDTGKVCCNHLFSSQLACTDTLRASTTTSRQTQ